MTTSLTPASGTTAIPAGDDAVAAFRATVVNKLLYSVGKDTSHARDFDWYVATALATRDQVTGHWMDSTRRSYREGGKRVYYFSLEFLIGRLLFDHLGNLGLIDTARAALASLGVDLDHLRTLEPDPALGNGGLGRLAACFLDSMATMGVAGYGYGCLLYTSPSPRDRTRSRMPSSA